MIHFNLRGKKRVSREYGSSLLKDLKGSYREKNSEDFLKWDVK